MGPRLTRSVYDIVRVPPLVLDVLLAVLLMVPAFVQWQVGAYPLASAVSYSILLIAPLAIRRILPVLSFSMVVALCALQLQVLQRPVWGDVAILVSLESVARYGPTWARWAALPIGLAGAFLGPSQWIGGFQSLQHRRELYPLLLALVGVVACWILGDLRRTRAQYVRELEERTRRLAVERDQQAVIAAAAERQRIAREMHDVVAHTLSVIVVQADGGRYAAERDPAAAKQVLETIAGSARDALAEMRRLLGLLRSGDEESLAPQPDVDDVVRLVERVDASGMAVRLDVVGRPRAIDKGTGLTVYRIVQEGLTNTMKHAGLGASATVRLEYGPHDLTVCVADDGAGPTGWPGRDGAGQGLVGMRERVELHGGRLAVRARPEGGFELRAVVPLTGGPAA